MSADVVPDSGLRILREGESALAELQRRLNMGPDGPRKFDDRDIMIADFMFRMGACYVADRMQKILNREDA